jgi:hypothetical protein
MSQDRRPANASKVEIVREYYRRSDAGDFPAELFTQDFQFYFPKFGVGHGAAEFIELAGGLMGATMKRAAHHRDALVFIEQRDLVAAEGTTEGLGADGIEWCGGKTPGGRFCSVFAFNPDGLIARMHIYLDPDYTSRDRDRFVWPERATPQW